MLDTDFDKLFGLVVRTWQEQFGNLLPSSNPGLYGGQNYFQSQPRGILPPFFVYSYKTSTNVF